MQGQVCCDAANQEQLGIHEHLLEILFHAKTPHILLCIILSAISIVAQKAAARNEDFFFRKVRLPKE